MKYSTTILILMSLLCSNIYAQKHDYNWLIGYVTVTQETANRNGMRIDFNGDQVQATIFTKEQYFYLTNLAYSDAEGALQLYSPGCAFFDENGVLFENGSDIHAGPFFCDGDSDSDYPADQGMLALPTSDPDIVSVFYNEEIIGQDTSGVYIYVNVLKALLDIRQNIVLSKKETLLDSLSGNILSATKHANGQDWWIINQDYFTNEYKCLLISEGEVIDTVSTFIGNPIVAHGAQQSNFSPDGSMFARFNPSDELQLYDFDRSTGKLSNFRFIDVPSTLEGTLHSGGLSFSGSSRFLYVNDALGIWQYDLEANNLADSGVQVAERDTFISDLDGFGNPTPTFFYRMALADRKSVV